jgi:PAS domain S-box-containing protein
MTPSLIRILHLEDEETDAELIARFLRKSGVDCEIKLVNTRDQYLHEIYDFKPTIILSDHSLPEFNSMEALEILRKSQINIPFILVTGAVSEEFGAVAIRKGVDDYILKDRMNRLPAAIENALSKYRAIQNQKDAQQEKEDAQKRIQESEKQYVQLVHDLPAAVCTCDEEGHIKLYNKAAVALWGRKPEPGELWCGSWKVFDSNSNLLKREDLPMSHALREGRKMEAEIKIQRPDGTTRLVMSHPSPTVDSTGRVTGGSNVMIDITEIKKANLQSMLLVDRLQVKNKELSQFGYMISHNLRAPIARILGLSSIFDTDPLENKFIIEKIAEATGELDETIRDINAIISARDCDNEKREAIALEPKIDLIKQVLANEFQQSGATLSTDFTEVKAVYAVRSYLYSVLHNLISNSIKFRKPDSPLSIHVQSSKVEDFICLSVKDNGLGIDLSKYGSKVFGLYKKFHGAATGKGIGLHLVKAQVEALGGKVEVDSLVNQGTEFKIYLPIHDERTKQNHLTN